MSAQHDFRTKGSDELTFYVIDDLKSHNFAIYYYDTEKEAMEKFNALPKEAMTSIGATINVYSSVDLVQRINGEPIKVMDYLQMETFSERTDIKEAMNKLVEGLLISNQFISGVHPRCSVLTPIHNDVKPDPYLDNKVLYISPRTRSQALFASINELYIKGNGWMEAHDFLRAYPDGAFVNEQVPTILEINVNYKETDTGYLGQCDITPHAFVEMMKKTKEYAHSFADKKAAIERPKKKSGKASLDKQLMSAKTEQQKNKQSKKAEINQRRGEERE